MIDELKEQIKDIKETIEGLKDSAQKVKDALEKYDIKDITDIDSDKAQALMSDIQTAIAASDKCLRARKCTLVPFNKTDAENNWSGQGCCPGQTGHHLMPDGMFRDPSQAVKDKDLADWISKKPTERAGKTHADMVASSRNNQSTRKCWDKYTEGKGPVVCLEGTNNHHGSHGAAHAATKLALEDKILKSSMDYKDARNRIANILVPYGCSADCIKAQLDEAYEKLYTCGKLSDAEVTPHSGMPGDGNKTETGDRKRKG